MIQLHIDKVKLVSIHIIAWIILFLLPPFLLNNFERISSVAPLYYYFSCLLLIPTYYITRIFLKQKKSLSYILVTIICFLIFLYLPGLVLKVLSQDYTPLDVRPLNRIRQGLSILFFITLAVNIFEVARYFKKTSKEDRIARTEIELAMLKTQINPHFLFNSLNSIYYEAIEKSDIVPKAIMSLSNLMRYVLTEAESKYVTLQQEMNYIKGYIELQQLRLPEKTELEFTYLIDNDQNKIAPLLLIPFIENAFKYGISSSSETNIVIDLKVDNNRLIMLVENRVFLVNMSDGTNLGLENVNKRLELIYPQKYQLEILNNVETYKVQLSIDLG